MVPFTLIVLDRSKPEIRRVDVDLGAGIDDLFRSGLSGNGKPIVRVPLIPGKVIHCGNVISYDAKR
jgi:hypothetical protein